MGFLSCKQRYNNAEPQAAGKTRGVHRACGDARALSFHTSQPLKTVLRIYGAADAGLEGTEGTAERGILTLHINFTFTPEKMLIYVKNVI